MPAMSKPALALLAAASAASAWAANNQTAANDGLCCYAGCGAAPSGCNPAGTWCSQAPDHCTGNCHGTWCPSGPSPPPGPTPPPPPPSPGAEWCLSADDLGWDYNSGGGQLLDTGFSIKGGARAHSKAAFNILGGFIEFDLDTTGARVGLNNNVYTISPHLGPEGYQSIDQYCDGAVQHPMKANRSANDYWCLELDINEDNGNCGSQTAVHSVMGHVGGCDANGCCASTHWNSQKFKVRADVSEDGAFTVRMGDIFQNPNQDEGSKGVVRDTLRSRGAVIQASQWANPGGWLPVGECGAGGDLDASVYTVTNLRIKGSVVAGPKPRACSSMSSNAETMMVV